MVVGGGPVAAGKTRLLLEYGAKTVVVGKHLCPALVELIGRWGLEFSEREYRPDDQQGVMLVFACTDSPDVQAQILSDARRFGVLACRVDDGSVSDFCSAALIQRGEVCVAVSTSGSSPALAARIKRELEPYIGSHYGVAATLLGRVREQGYRGVAVNSDAGLGSGPPVDPEVFAELFGRGFLDLLARGQLQQAVALLEELCGWRHDAGPVEPVGPEIRRGKRKD